MTSSELRVLVHLNHLELGGTQLIGVDLASALAAHGVRSLLVGPEDTLPSSGPSVLDVIEARGLELELYVPAATQLPRARQVGAIARRFDADLLHVYGSWGGGAGAAYWGPSRFGRIPWLQTVYEMEVSPKIKRHMPLVVGTEYLIEELEDRPGRTILVRPPVDLGSDRPGLPEGPEFRREHGLGDGPLLLIVSRLDVNTKVLPIGVAIDSMALLAGTGATLVVVGDGEGMPQLSERARRVNAVAGREAVMMLGALADPRPAYAAADVMIAMGGSAARSLAFGKPLIVQGFTGWSSLLDSGNARALARMSYWSPESVPDPVERLAAIARPLVTDAVLRTELGAFGRAFATETFGLDAMAARLADFYRESMSAYGLRSWLADLPSEGAVVRDKLARRLGSLRRDRGSHEAVEAT